MKWAKTIGLGFVWGILGGMMALQVFDWVLPSEIANGFFAPVGLIAKFLADTFQAEGEEGMAYLYPAFAIYLGSIGVVIASITKLVRRHHSE